MYKVLFICLGNICRSPLAEALFMKLVNENQLNNRFAADSCGLLDFHKGDLADPRTRQIAIKYGLEIVHRSRPITANDFYNFDELLVMDEAVFSKVMEMKPPHFDSSQIKLFRNFDPYQPGTDVPDPYYKDIAVFEEVHLIVERCAANYLKALL